MHSQFFTDNFSFVSFSLEHWCSILVFTLLFIVFLWMTLNKKETETQRRILIISCIAIFIVQIMKVCIKMYLGNFDSSQDLPLHLCNTLPVFLAFAFARRRRVEWAICFLLIMTGTFQSLITPTLEHSFPHYEYWRYWIIHVGLVLLAIAPTMIWKYRIVLKDVFWGWIAINIIAFSVMAINVPLRSNYMYMQAKPSGQTIYDLLGPWPWYILSLEFVSILLFLLAYLPFWIIKRRS